MFGHVGKQAAELLSIFLRVSFTSIGMMGQKNWEDSFPHYNWILIVLFQLVISSSWSVMTPSLYQFITTPRSLPEELENEEDANRFWPGLGGSDIDYAWAKMAQPLFEVLTMPFAAVAIKRVPITATVLLSLLLFAVGGLVYALAVNVWMVLTGKSFFGVAITLGLVSTHVYFGEMGAAMDEIRRRKNKKPLKFIIYVSYTFTFSGGLLASAALTSVMAQFSNLSPYRWPEWFLTVLSTMFAVVMIFCFTETPPPYHAKPSPLTCSCGLSNHLFLIGCAYMIGQLFSTLSTLVSPVLSDSFGFSVKYTSYFITMLSAASFGTSFIQLGTRLAKIENRQLLGLTLVLALIGSVLVADWQAIGHDPCYSLYRTYTTSQSSYNSTNSSIVCEGLSNSSYQCFWSPQSRITGEFCNTCLDTCLSKQKSLSIYQYSVGMLLLALAAPMGDVLFSAITVDITPLESQGIYLGLVLGSTATARTISPYWFIESYLLTGRHTYFSMTITAGFILVLLVSLAALYRNLAPRTTRINDEPTFSATSRLGIVEHAPDVEVELAGESNVSGEDKSDYEANDFM